MAEQDDEDRNDSSLTLSAGHLQPRTETRHPTFRVRSRDPKRLQEATHRSVVSSHHSFTEIIEICAKIIPQPVCFLNREENSYALRVAQDGHQPQPTGPIPTQDKEETGTAPPSVSEDISVFIPASGLSGRCYLLGDFNP